MRVAFRSTSYLSTDPSLLIHLLLRPRLSLGLLIQLMHTFPSPLPPRPQISWRDIPPSFATVSFLGICPCTYLQDLASNSCGGVCGGVEAYTAWPMLSEFDADQNLTL